ncbi:hypothetical protein [uncultured Aquimarina sp.]|uniref:hypothetical protein n=1 Tax=uncultured Aquimarina sp. TaxID=575652 RepID=UPI002627F958|nr:hypothetical protein [uncultured Aquimarina sp.]
MNLKNLLIILFFVNCFSLVAQHVDEQSPKIDKEQNTFSKTGKEEKKSLNSKRISKSAKLSAKEQQDLQILHDKRLKKNKELKQKAISKKGRKENIKVYDKKDPSGL